MPRIDRATVIAPANESPITSLELQNLAGLLDARTAAAPQHPNPTVPNTKRALFESEGLQGSTLFRKEAHPLLSSLTKLIC